MKQLTVLGSTGSIGCSTLDVVRHNPGRFSVAALVAGKNVDRMVEQCLEFTPRYAVMDDAQSAERLRTRLHEHGSRTEVLSGQQAAAEVAALDEVDQVMAAIVGAAGLVPTLAAIRAGKTVLLANKESLVTCGRLFMEAVQQSGARLLPVDSEHNAIFQSMPETIQQHLGYADLARNGVSSILLTGSGGPFRETAVAELAAMTPDQACRHPNWSMGRKISVDSATMMNKGLEYIEARWLFNASAQQMEVLIHPQSVIHSMVQFEDGAVIAQLGIPDMKLPIAYAFSFPTRMRSMAPRLDFNQYSTLTFEEPDMERFRNLAFAFEAARQGGNMPCILNAANEVVVAAFLQDRIGFLQMSDVIEQTMRKASFIVNPSYEDYVATDAEARRLAAELF